MEIIQKGEKIVWSKKVKCVGKKQIHGCGAWLLISNLDLFWIHVLPHGERKEEHLTAFECPVCRTESYIKVPDNIPRSGKRPWLAREKRRFSKMMGKSSVK